MIAQSPYKKFQSIKNLIWLYFWILIFEGALRKWFFPQYADILLVVRDPILLLIYFRALALNIFPQNNFISTLIILAILSFSVGVIIVGDWVTILYGIRTNYLHLPLIFLMPKVFNRNDVIKLGKWILIISIPMAILMGFQFALPPNHILNAAVSVQGLEAGHQIGAAFGRIRPAGTFSFVAGPMCFYPLVCSFLMFGITQKKMYSGLLLLLTGVSLITASIVSGSRSVVMGVGIVLAFLFFLGREIFEQLPASW